MNRFIYEIKRITPIALRLARTKTLAALTTIFTEKVLIKNIFHSNYDKRVIISFLPEAFNNKTISKKHTNLTECYEAGKIFHELGYVVDCCNMSHPSINTDDYDILYGSIATLKSSFSTQNNQLKIAYCPGAQYFFAIDATAKRTLAVFSDKKKWFTSSIRYANASCWGHYAPLFADHVVILGNDFVKNEFLKYDNRPEHYSNLPAFFFHCHTPNLENKDYEKAKTHFLWFGSLGLIHKGLDICLDIAINHPEITLHICGASKRDKEFWNYYKPLIKGKSNIIDYGFVDIESQTFADILNCCAFLVNPSISEGCCTSLLTTVGNGGLIPIYSQASGIDCKEVGIEVSDVSYAAFWNAIKQSLCMSTEQIKTFSKAAHKLMLEKYTLENYRNNLRQIISNVCREESLTNDDPAISKE